MKSRRDADGDIRVLGDHRGKDGKRHLSLQDVVVLMRQTELADNPLPGDRVVKEFLTSIADGPGNLTSYNSNWERMSGVSRHSAIAHDHRIMTEALRLAHDVDQIDVSNLLSFELLVRRLCQHETAVERNPQHPDYSGLDLAMGGVTSKSGAARTSKYSAWLTTEMKDRGTMLRNFRLYKGETARGAVSSEEEDWGDWSSKKKKKKKRPWRAPAPADNAGGGEG